MAYSLRDIIKQRTGEVASSGIPTIYKLREDKLWIESTDITVIGKNAFLRDYKKRHLEFPNELPKHVYIKQVCSNVTEVHNIKVENDIISEDIFKYAHKVKDFSYLFEDRYIKTIPSGLFEKCENVIDFSWAFSVHFPTVE